MRYGKHNSSKLGLGRMVLDLIVETSQQTDNQEDFVSETCSDSKMAVGTSSGMNSEDHECSAMDTVSAKVGVFDHSVH